MKIYRTYEKEIEKWSYHIDPFPTSFTVCLTEKGEITNVSYQERLKEWVEKKSKYLEDVGFHNVEVDWGKKIISYEKPDDDTDEVTEEYEVETVKELTKLMKQFDCGYFTQNDSNRWYIE